MPTTVTERFDESPERLWSLLGDFEGIDGVFPAVSDVVATPQQRTFTLFGMRLTEELRRRDEASRTLAYGITDGLDVEGHEAVIEVVPDGDGSTVRWTVTTTPAEAEPLFSDSYASALRDLRARLTTEGGSARP